MTYKSKKIGVNAIEKKLFLYYIALGKRLKVIDPVFIFLARIIPNNKNITYSFV